MVTSNVLFLTDRLGVVDEAPAEKFSDIEEALAELFEAEGLLSSIMGTCLPEVVAASEKIRRACFLLDRPWP